ncbi:SGNH hydrolase-type esterase domain-containing protein [Phyllosticta citribraziliensis]|uniref:SGNH hydrolase-type esterase domain-containing protein n=1 Tax=Phyllosticta citribraziliensis TaxID=989973 RepID=A0ABR1LTY6_9PEZI
MPALYDEFLLFGDSITQASAPNDGFGFAAALAKAYARRLDVVNRGFSGYTTEQALKVLPRFMPTPDHAKVRLMTVFFGANDACVKGGSTGQHVPLETYVENLKAICTHDVVKAHNPRLIIITPPPINEWKMEATDQAKGHNGLQRTAEQTKTYANAARKVGEELGIPVLDLWTIFMSRAGWVAGEPLPGCKSVPRNDLIEELMYDGLHLSPRAYEIVVEELQSLIACAYPDQIADELAPVLPNWNDGDAWKKFEGGCSK